MDAPRFMADSDGPPRSEEAEHGATGSSDDVTGRDVVVSHGVSSRNQDLQIKEMVKVHRE